MAQQVRLCRDSAGYFATLRPGVPAHVRVYWSTEIRDLGLAIRVLDLAHVVAQGLTQRDERARLAAAVARPPLFG